MLKPEIGSLWTLEMGEHRYTGMITGYDMDGYVRILVLTSTMHSALGDTFTCHAKAFSKEKEEDEDLWLPLS